MPAACEAAAGAGPAQSRFRGNSETRPLPAL